MKTSYLITIFLLSSLLGYSQEYSTSFTLDETIPANQTKDMVARDFIKFEVDYPQGFSAAPDLNNFVHANIDPMLVIPPPMGDVTGGPPNNWGGAVGSLPGNLMITPMGAAVYNIPIEVPPGITNLTPELSFVYNSQAGDGIMGNGWSISGLSKISRVPYTYYYNKFTASVVLNNEDQLSLDGNYLKKENDIEYKLEVEDFSKIVLINPENRDDGFIVYKKNGLKYYYGTDEQSRYYLQSGPPIAWYLTKISDLNNNYIEFHYINDTQEGSFYPDYILYTGNSNAGTDPYYKIEFKYRVNERVDTPKKYFTNPGNPQALFSRITKYLSGVIIKYIPNDKELVDYTLVYSDGGFLSKKYLKKILPTYDYNGSRSTNTLNPTIFNWFNSDYKIESDSIDLNLYYNDENEMFKQQSVFACNFVDRPFGDIPLSDILHVSKTDHDNKYHIRAYLNMSGYGSNNFSFNFNTSVYEHSGFQEGEMLHISTGDFNGDGYDEIVRIYKVGNLAHIKIGNFDFETPLNGYSEVSVKSFGLSDYNSSKPPIFLVGDFSGNGYDDICMINYVSAYSAYCQFFLSKKDMPLNTILSSGGTGFQYPEEVMLGDFNGNAKSEILIIGDISSDIISLRKDNISITVSNVDADFGVYSSSNDFVAGDFNNDAKTDILLLKAGSEDNWVFYYSYGKGVFVKNDPITVEYTANDGVSTIATDVNGDGYSDLCWVWYSWLKNTGKDNIRDFYRADFLINPKKDEIQIKRVDYDTPIATINHDEEKDNINFCIGNFSGNTAGQLVSSRIIAQNNGDLYTKINLSAPLSNSYINNINKITNGLGVETNIYYSPFTAVPFLSKNADDVNVTVDDLPFPIINYGGILNVVTSYEQEVEEEFNIDHEQKFLSISYIYTNAKYHQIGKGFLGFRKVQQINNLNSTYTNRYFNIDNPYFHIVNNINKSFQKDDFKQISLTENEYEFDGLNDPDFIRYFFKLKQKTVSLYDITGTGLKTKQETTYDNYDLYGNPKTITNYYSTVDDAWPIKKTQSINYLNITEDGVHALGLIDDITTVYWTAEDGNRESKVDNEYDLSTALLNSTTYESGNPKSYTVEYSYDEGLNTFGNLTQKKLTAQTGIEPRVWLYKYTDNGRFLESTINPEMHKESYNYYEDIGKLRTKTDPNGLTTTYEYNIFGRLKKETFADGTFSYNIKRWCVSGSSTEHEDAPETAIYYNWTVIAGNPEVLTFYNQFNQDVRNVTNGFDGTKIYRDKKYYGETEIYTGLQYYESIPYFKPSDPSFVPPSANTSYNKLRQLSRVDKPDGSFKTIEHDKNTNTITNFDGQKTKLEYNGANWLTKVTDNEEIDITYAYRSNGLLKSTEVDNNSTTRIEYIYDDFGQPILINRPNNGITRYTYNSFGNLINETDELSSVAYTVDKLSRITSEVADDYSSAWQYDTQTNGIGKLHYTVHGPNTGHVQAVVYENYYNEFGYLTMEKQILNAKSLIFEYTYDAFGRLKQTTWPSGFISTNNYNEFGKQVSILDKNSAQLWRAGEMNAFEQYTKTVLGTCVDMEVSHDPNNGYITDIVAKNINNYQFIQSYNYLWKSNGNLKHRKDNLKHLTEYFEYDPYNRLKTVTLNNTPQLEIDFKKNGNINKKSDLGGESYTYQFNKPNAVETIPSTPASISQNYQSIEYTSFDKVYHISEKEDINSQEDIYTFDMGFGPYHERVWQKFTDKITSKSTEKRYFNTIYEELEDENGNKKQRHYIVAPTGLFAIFTIENEEVETTNYILKDHLGSINYIVDDEGNVEQELNFDAWGQRRNPVTWQYYDANATRPIPMFERGYTMHEHLDAFKLINMNGRMYDPVVARFLSPDPIIQSPENSQSYNSYSYVFNNPLRLTDPSGFVAIGDSTGNGNSTFGNTAVKNAFNVVDPNGGDESASSFNTDDTQKGKSQRPIVFINPDLPSKSQSKLKRRTAISVRQVGSAGGGDGLTLSETGTMATVMGMTNTFTRSLIDWGLRQATTPWGNSISGFNKFSKGSGKFLGYYSGFVYSMQARNAYSNGDRLHTLSNGLMSFYSLVATKGGTPGLVFTAPFFVIDWTIGMDNFLLYNLNYGIEQSNQIQNGNWGVSLWRPGQGLR